jgi:hypothetical protein
MPLSAHAHARTLRPSTRLRLSETLSSADTPGMRAAKILHLMGMTGDPKLIDQHFNVIADCLEHYAELDRSGT